MTSTATTATTAPGNTVGGAPAVLDRLESALVSTGALDDRSFVTVDPTSAGHPPLSMVRSWSWRRAAGPVSRWASSSASARSLKLGATRRNEAVRRARQLEIL
jgi:hypothetical protein